MKKLTLLEESQIFDDKALDVIKKRGIKAAITDFSILLGGFVSNNYHVDGYNSLDKRTGYYWTKTDDGDNDARVVDTAGDSHNCNVYERTGGLRPALSFSSIHQISTNKVSGRAKDGILEVEYGYYPRSAVSKNLQKELEKMYNQGHLNVKRNYTTDSRKYDEYDKPFLHQIHVEYEYNGKKYVRVKANPYNDEFTLSNKETYNRGDYVWVEIEPVKWLVDEKAKIMITEELIVAGIQFKNTSDYKGDFSKTDMKKFMDKYLSIELFRNKELDINNSKVNNVYSRKKNPYNFDFSEVSEEDIIKGAIQSGISVLLHGRSSEGKSARVKQLDPDCEIIYLANATPESLNGKSVAITDQQTFEMMKEMYDKGEITFDKLIESSKKIIDIKPTWLIKLEERCEREKEKIHIVFLDEITNALPSIQNMAFNLVLDREVNGRWKLPENARVVAAGNELRDSLSANELTEPLYNRFCHVYIETTVESWLKWASTPEEEYKRIEYKKEGEMPKIHPAVYAFIAYRGEEALRTEYTGIKPNADPRKWEMASKVLYTTGMPEMIRGLVGEEVTYDFVNFCKEQVITVEDVINNNYTESDLDMNLSEKYATALGLSSVSDEHVEVVRDFVEKLGPEITATFDNIWIHGDERRLERIAELRISNLNNVKKKIRV